MFSKVQQKADFYIGSFQVIDKLQLVFTAEALDSFQFQNNMVVDKDVCKIFSHLFSLIIDLYLVLCLAIESTSLEFLKECILIYPFQKTISQRVIYFVKRRYNLVRFVFIKILFNHISLFK